MTQAGSPDVIGFDGTSFAELVAGSSARQPIRVALGAGGGRKRAR